MNKNYTWQTYTINPESSGIAKGGSCYIFDNTIGTADVLVDGAVLQVGAELTLDDAQGGIDLTAHKVDFPSGVGQITVRIKTYQ